RKSVRKFSGKKIEKDKLSRILETLRIAPSAVNSQPWFFYIIKDDLRERFNDVFFKDCFYPAPAVVVGCAVKEQAWVRKYDNVNYAWTDTAIALTQMISAATAEGIGSCWVASFDVEKTVKLLDLPDNMQIVSLVVLGYPEEPFIAEDKKRKDFSEIIKIL
ncbi:nitroreductase family protein, partial [bacterium]|nr:nitroreductase family protein [bacterium]